MSAAVDESRKHHRNHSHEHDTEIRLPGSLDESRPAMRRNLTAYQLPRNASHAKLKKNLSHGQLNRLPSGKNLVALASAQQRTPTSPRIKGKQKRPKSAEIMLLDKNLQDREVEVEQQQSRAAGPSKSRAEDPKKVGFNVGNESDEDESPEFEDGEQQEDEWTEESASASPYSTRQNTANNSRRESVVADRPAVKQPPLQLLKKVNHRVQQHAQATQQAGSVGSPVQQSREPETVRDAAPKFQRVGFAEPKQEETREAAMGVKADAAHRAAQQLKAELSHPASHKPESDDDNDSDIASVSASASDESISPNSSVRSAAFDGSKKNSASTANAPKPATQTPTPKAPQSEQAPLPVQRIRANSDAKHTPPQQVKEHVNPTVRRFTPQAPAPAVVSAVSALDDTHSSHGSPAPSLRSSKSNIADGSGERDPDELVSRFVPSTSHPSNVSGANTAANTPKQTSFYGGEHHSERHASGSHPTSPGSVVSSGSGTTTPAIGRSRTETRLMQQKALADREDLQSRDLPTLPAWQYDRLNKSLKSSLNPTRLPTKDNPKGGLIFPGPEAFQGRFRVTNTELRVVQKFRDPIGESIARLRLVKGSKVQQRALAQKRPGSIMASNKSMISVPAAQKSSTNANLAKSASPPYVNSPLKQRAAANGEGQSAVPSLANGRQRPKSQLDLARAPPQSQTRDFERVDEKQANEDVLRGLWNQCLEPNEKSNFH